MMMKMLHGFLLLLTAGAALVAASDLPQYCQLETFTAECAPDAVIMMTSALYGRMRIGRCVKEDILGYTGCYADVTRQMDQLCSGRQTCKVGIPHTLLEVTNPCLSGEFRNYLEADYKCVQVIAPMNTCTDNVPIEISNKESGYLSSAVATFSGCGMGDSPWVLKTKPGQRFKLTLFDFNYGKSTQLSPVISEAHCDAYAVLDDRSAKRTSNVCPSLTRESHVYTSVNNTLQVEFMRTTPGKELAYVLIYFEVEGCPDLKVPLDMEFTRVGEDSARVSCLDGSIRYHLTCTKRAWVGDYQNCTKHDFEPRATPENQYPMGGILLVVFVAVGLIAGLAIIAVFIYCFYRQRRSRNSRIPMNYRDPHIYGPAGRNEVIYACKAHSNNDLLGDSLDLGGDYAGYKSMPMRARTVGHPPRCTHCEEFLREGGGESNYPELYYPQEIACNVHNERIYVPVRSPASPRYTVKLNQSKDNNLDIENNFESENKKFEKPQSPDIITVPRTPKISNQMNNKRQITRNKSFDDDLEPAKLKTFSKPDRTPVPRHVSATNSMGTL